MASLAMNAIVNIEKMYACNTGSNISKNAFAGNGIIVSKIGMLQN
jgi:hypothetical protein